MNRAFTLPSLFGILILMVLAGDVHGQEEPEAEFQTWLDYTATLQIGNKWYFDPNAGVRGIIAPDDWSQVFVRPSFAYLAAGWLKVYGGVGLWYSFEQDEDDTFEVRPWQGAKLSWPDLGPVFFTHFLRLEERMVVSPSWDSTLRLRYRLELMSSRWEFGFLPKRPFYAFVGAEIFEDLAGDVSEHYVNKNRANIGLACQFAWNWRVEVQYLQQHSRRNSNEGFETTENILRLSFARDIERLLTIF